MRKIALYFLSIIMLLVFAYGIIVLVGLYLGERQSRMPSSTIGLDNLKITINFVSIENKGTILYAIEYPHMKFIHIGFAPGDLLLRDVPLKAGDKVELELLIGNAVGLNMNSNEDGMAFIYGLKLANGTMIYDPEQELKKGIAIKHRTIDFLSLMIGIPLLYFTGLAACWFYKRRIAYTARTLT